MGTDVFPAGIAGEVVAGGDGLPLLWAHGLTSSRADEDTARLFRWAVPGPLVRWDAPGHGASAALVDPAALHWRSLAGLMLGIADRVPADRFIAGGASQGAATSVWAAVLAPERVAGLLLVIPPTGWEARAAQADLYAAAADLVDSGGVEAMLRAQAAQPVPAVFASVAGEVRQARAESLRRFAPANLARVLRAAAGSDLPARDVLRAVPAPALVLAWAGDSGHPVSTAAELARLLPAAQLHVAEDLAGVLGWQPLVADWLAAVAGQPVR